jgi:hypothetical protein
MAKKFLLLALLASVFTACEDRPTIKRSSGGICEVLVATDNEQVWKGSIGDTIRQYFAQYLTGLPMPEESFYALHTLSGTLFRDDFHKPRHNILIVNIDTSVKTPYIDSKKNHWASPQQIVRFVCPTDTSFFRLFRQYYKSLFTLFRDTEKTRVVNMFSSNPSKSIIAKLKSNYGIDMLIPGGFNIAAETPDFIWLRQSIHRRKQDTETGFMIYIQPYTDTAAFAPDHIIRTRDSVAKKYIPGPSDGSYMATSTEFIPPEFNRTRRFSTGFAVETRGLWKVVNDFMGGPFISYTFVDTHRNRLITAEGYLYNPNAEQRKFVLQIEALLNTIKIVDESSQ